MQFNLTPEDVVTALKAHITQQMGIDLSNKTVAFTFKNKRNKGGVIAGVTITPTALNPSVAAILQAPVPALQQELDLAPVSVSEASVEVAAPVPQPEPVVPTTPTIVAPSLFD